MAIRRPRIKPIANIQLNGKRKQKTIQNAKNIKENTCTANEFANNTSETNIHQAEIENMQNNVAKMDVDATYKQSGDKPLELESDVKNEAELQKAINNDKNISNGITLVENSANVNLDIIENNLEFNELQNASNRVTSINEALTKNDCKLQELNSVNFNVNILQNASNRVTSINEALTKNDCKLQELNSVNFKYPPKIDNNRSIVNGVDDVLCSDLEDNILQMDLHKLSNFYPLSPTKAQARQRIRATPIFGQRRNSFVSSTTHSNFHEDTTNNVEHSSVINQRRERHSFSSSAAVTDTIQNRQINAMAGRTRTESDCSGISEITSPYAHKPRKPDDQQHRQHIKRDFESRFVNGVPNKSTIKIVDLIYYNPDNNPIEEKPINLNIKHEINNEISNNINVIDQADVTLNESQEKSLNSKQLILEGKKEQTCLSTPVPQLKLNANGELILDDKSLVIETTAAQEARKTLANTEPIFLDEFTGTNGFYKKKKRTREWSAEETIKFYRCLHSVGTDFTLMVSLFPNRTRRDLKFKFKKEERINGALINKALLYPKKFNIEEIKQQMEKDEEDDKKKKEYMLYVHKTKKKTKKTYCRSTAQRLLESGDENIYQSKNIKKLIQKSRNNKKDKEQSRKNNKEQSSLNLNKCNEKEGQGTNEKLLKRRHPNNNRELNANKKKKHHNKNDVHFTQTTPPSTQKRHNKPLPLKEEIIQRELLSHLNTNAVLLKKEENTEIKTELNRLLQPGLNEIPDIIINDNNKNNEDTIAPIQYKFQPLGVNLNVFTNQLENNQKDEEKEFISINFENTLPISASDLESNSSNSDSSFGSKRTITNDDGTIMSTNDENQFQLLSNATSIEIDTQIKREIAIQKIINELAEGSFVLVSTSDPNNSDKIIHEIYKIDQNTNELEGEPLHIPEYIIQSILSLLGD